MIRLERNTPKASTLLALTELEIFLEDEIVAATQG